MRRVAPVGNAWSQWPGLRVEMVSAQGLSPQSPLVVGKAYGVRLDCAANTTTRTPITELEDPGYVGASRRGRVLFIGIPVSEGLGSDAGGFPGSFRRRVECWLRKIITGGNRKESVMFLVVRKTPPHVAYSYYLFNK